jgi:UDP-N-acetylglucosamine--N-acetylmuramyl-(pentapeptide) pyrophosphoryl-undecaprenol N-acetylglucosamine transferase
MRIIIAGGGTLGHIYPGLTIADKLRQKANILFIGTTAGIESNLIQKHGFEFKGIDIQAPKKKIKFIFKLTKAILLSIKYIKEFKPDVIIGMGGYASLPVVLSGILFKIKTLIHEQNIIPGKANRLLAKFVDKIAISFEESKKYLPLKKIVLTGNPVRIHNGQINKDETLTKFGLDKDKFTLLIFGGSKGAHKINEIMTQVINFLPKDKIQIIWATGDKDYEEIKEISSKSTLKIVIDKFFYDLPALYRIADLAIVRAGATTVAEIIICNLPAILIPYPYATDKHQEYNAKLLAEKKAGIMIKEYELSVEKLTNTITELAKNPDKLKAMAENYQALKINNATQNMINVIYSLK